MNYKAILGITTPMQSLALVGASVKHAKKPTMKGMIKTGAGIIVGTSLIGASAKSIAEL